MKEGGMGSALPALGTLAVGTTGAFGRWVK